MGTMPDLQRQQKAHNYSGQQGSDFQRRLSEGAGVGLVNDKIYKDNFSDSDTDNDFEVIRDKPPARRKPVKPSLSKAEESTPAGIAKMKAYAKADEKFRKSRGVVGLVKTGGKQVPVFDPKLHNKQYYSDK